MPNEYWDFSKSGRKNAERYLEICAEDGRTPKFPFLLEQKNGKYILPKGEIGDNYFKLLIDFKMYNNEGKGRPQTPVKPVFDMEVANRTLSEYEGDHNKSHAHMDIVDSFVKQYKEENPNARYSLNLYEDKNGKIIPVIDNQFKAKDFSKNASEIFSYVEEELNKLAGTSVIIKSNNKEVFFDRIGSHEYVSSDNTQNLYRDNKALKMNASNEIHDIVENAEYKNSKIAGEDHNHSWSDARNGFDYYNVEFAVNMGNRFDLAGATLIVRKDINDINFVYDLVNPRIKKKDITLTPVKTGSENGPTSNKMPIPSPSNGNNTIGDSTKSTKLSLKVDSDGNNLTGQQAEYFKDSKIVDENGNLKVMYHGSRNPGFTIFDPRYSDDGISMFFTDNAENAASYSGTREIYSPDRKYSYEELSNIIENTTNGDWEVAKTGKDYVILEDGETEVARGTLNDIRDYFIDNYLQNEIERNGANYQVYLNITNPLVIDAKKKKWNNLSEFSLTGEKNTIKYKYVENWDWSKGMPRRFEVTDSNGNVRNLTSDEIYDEFGEYIGDVVSLFDDGETINVAKNGLNTTRDFAKYAKENGYDGVIIKNLVDYDDKLDVSHKPSTVAIIFDSNQVKSINNENPTSSNDIRYALELGDPIEFEEAEHREVGFTGGRNSAASILAEGMEALKNQKVDTGKIHKLAEKIKADYKSRYDLDTLEDNLTKAFAYMQSQEFVNYDTMMSIINDIARPVIETSEDVVGEKDFVEFIRNIKKQKISLTDEQKTSVIKTFGSYSNFELIIKPLEITHDGNSLTSVWDNLCEAYPNLFERSVSDADKPLALYDAIETMRPTLKNDFGGDIEDVARNLAMRIVGEYVEGEASKKMSQKMDTYKKKLKADYDRRLESVKQKQNPELYARNKAKAQKAKERQQIADTKKKITARAGKLLKWVSNPTEKNHVPRALVSPVIDFLYGIDFVQPDIVATKDGKYKTKVFNRTTIDENGKRKIVFDTITGDSEYDVLMKFNEAIGRGKGSQNQRKWTERMRLVQDLFKQVETGTQFEDTELDSLMHTLDASLATEFSDMLTRNMNTVSINQLGLKDIKVVNSVLNNLLHAINQGNKAYTINEEINALAEETIKASEGKNIKSHNKAVEGIIKNLRIDNLNPRVFMNLLGDSGKKMYKSLRNGLNTKILDIKKASDFMVEQTKNIDKKLFIKWSGKKAYVHEIQVANGIVKMTTGQIMGLYETMKRTGADERIKGGIKAGEIPRNGASIIQDKAIHLTEADLSKIFAVLTDEQKTFADKLQQYMAVECSKDGNETSMRLYGYEKFLDPTYYPYRVDKLTVATTDQALNTSSLNGIERSGFTKELKEHASNPLIIDDIFDVFSDHVAEMAAYHGYAAANKDVLRWFNYRSKTNDNGYDIWKTNKDAINRISGTRSATEYVVKMLKDINGNEKSNYIGSFTEKLIGNYKAASVGANLSVIVQQPTAFARAVYMVNPKYLIGALANPVKGIKNIEKAKEYSAIAWWKSQGYYETNVGKSLKQIITGQESTSEAIKEKMMSPAGIADDITWGFLYTAIENEQRAKLRGKNYTEAQFRQAVNERFDEVVDATQVVDTTLHRSQLMRSKDKLNVIQTAYGGEPNKTFNMFVEAVIEDAREGKFKRTPKAVIAFLLSSIGAAAAKSVVTTMRHIKDDDDWEEVYLNELKENDLDNINPFNLLPVVKDISASIMNVITGEPTFGQSSGRLDMDAITSLTTTIQAWQKYMNGEGTKNEFGMLMTTLKPISQITGIPVYNLVRDTTAIYNQFGKDLETSIRNATSYKKGVIKATESRKSSEERITEQVAEATKNNLTIKDIRSYLSTQYKNTYLDLVEEGKTDEAEDLANMVIPAYKATGMSEEEAKEVIAGWNKTEESAYTTLNKAIKAGENIEEAVLNAKEAGKKDEDIIEKILTNFGDTVEFETNNTKETFWKDNVEKAIKAVDGTLDYEIAKEEYAEREKAKAEAKAISEAKSEAKQSIIDSVSKGEAIDEKLKEYVESVDNPEKIKDSLSSVKSSITSEFKPLYIEAVNNKDYSKANDIQRNVAKAKATIDKRIKTNIPKKYGSDYYKYELDQIKSEWK